MMSHHLHVVFCLLVCVCVSFCLACLPVSLSVCTGVASLDVLLAFADLALQAFHDL